MTTTKRPHLSLATNDADSSPDVSQSTITDIARAVLDTQSRALNTVASHLSTSFEDTVAAILQCHTEQGRVIATGIGKAGHIAQKFSATLASVGISSFFINPAEALHGDIGRVALGDSAIVFSFSGESHEIVSLIPRLRERSCKILGITKSKESSLGRLSDQVIELGAIEECPPLHIAPTTSTTVMLAISDAIAMASCVVRGFDRTQYGRLHPAGDIGRRLVQVSEVMRVGEYLCIVEETSSVRDVIAAFCRTPRSPGAAAVIAKTGKLAGIFTDGDLRRLLIRDSDLLDKPVSTVMGKNPKVIPPTASVREALDLITQIQVDQLLVVGDSGGPVGLVDIQDLAGFLRGEPVVGSNG